MVFLAIYNQKKKVPLECDRINKQLINKYIFISVKAQDMTERLKSAVCRPANQSSQMVIKEN